MKCREIIVEDHVVIRRTLDILDGMVNRMEDGLRIEIADATAILKFLRVFADEYHQTMEETVLFPALLRAAPNDSPVHQMASEHYEERTAVSCIEDALKAKVGRDFVLSSRRLSRLLRDHFTKENGVLVELAEQLLNRDEEDAIVAEFQKNRPEVGAEFSRLEWKYIPTSRKNVPATVRPQASPAP
jgi:hemerythrin-like domain-containing protein